MEPDLSSSGSRGFEGAQVSNRCAPPSCFKGSGFEGLDKGTLFEEGADDIHLDPFSFSMDDPHFLESSFLALKEVVFQEERDLLGREGMKVNPVLNRDSDNIKF